MERIQFDYSKLKGRIKEKCGSQKVFAKLLGVSEATITAKLQGNTGFTQEDILKTIEILEIDPGEVSIYFFTVAV